MMKSNNGGLSRELRSEVIYAAAAANAWLRGMPLPRVALDYRYEPVTALSLIARLCDQCGVKNVEPWVPEHVLRCALLSRSGAVWFAPFPRSQDVRSRGPERSRALAAAGFTLDGEDRCCMESFERERRRYLAARFAQGHGAHSGAGTEAAR